MLGSSWVLNTSRGMMLPYPQLHVHAYVTFHQNILLGSVKLYSLNAWSAGLLWSAWLCRLMKYANSIVDSKLRGESFGQLLNPVDTSSHKYRVWLVQQMLLYMTTTLGTYTFALKVFPYFGLGPLVLISFVQLTMIQLCGNSLKKALSCFNMTTYLCTK